MYIQTYYCRYVPIINFRYLVNNMNHGWCLGYPHFNCGAYVIWGDKTVMIFSISQEEFNIIIILHVFGLGNILSVTIVRLKLARH